MFRYVERAGSISSSSSELSFAYPSELLVRCRKDRSSTESVKKLIEVVNIHGKHLDRSP